MVQLFLFAKTLIEEMNKPQQSWAVDKMRDYDNI